MKEKKLCYSENYKEEDPKVSRLELMHSYESGNMLQNKPKEIGRKTN